MQALINKIRFIKAIEYVSENFFSKPYSITPLVDRWFNQLAMIELANGEIIHLSGKLALDHVDIVVDGNPLDRSDILLVLKYKGQNSDVYKERNELIKSINLLSQKTPHACENEDLSQQLNTLKEKLANFDSAKIKADKLYEEIVDHGQISINEERLETTYCSKIKNIVYRPNHGLSHSVRAAYLITSLFSYAKEHSVENKNLDLIALEQLQMMMLFSVVGRKDETGFNDGVAGRATYEAFRTTSGKEFLQYAQLNSEHLYNTNLEQLYRDAIIVELMGYSSIDDAIVRRQSPPEVFFDYVIAKERSLGREINREDALHLVAMNKYTMSKFYPLGVIRDLANSKLEMMNEAHALDLTRCYSLFATKEGGSKSIGILNYHLIQASFYTKPSLEKLDSFYKLLRCEFDLLALTGQKSTFGLISREAFNESKAEIYKEINHLLDKFNNTSRHELSVEAKNNIKQIDSYFGKTHRGNLELIHDYRKYILLTAIAAKLTAAPRLKSDKALFTTHHSVEGNPHLVNHYQNALSLVNALNTITPVAEFDIAPLPLISSVTHDRVVNKTTLMFSDLQQAELCKETFCVTFGEMFYITPHNDGKYSLVVDRTNYQQLVKDQLVMFKQVEIPTSVNREESIVEDNGVIDALNLVAHSRALGRLVSTSALNNETFPDYDYLLKPLEDPVHERYTSTMREMAHFPIEQDKYYDPRDGKCILREKNQSPAPELRFQEPVTEPLKLADKIKDGWTKGVSGEFRNTIYTKKMAHTLVPPNGRMIPFEGYPGKKSNYFAIGVLSDIDLVDLKDERYVWSQNMDTVTKFWKRDTAYYNNFIYKFLNAKTDENGNPLHYPSSSSNEFPVVILDKSAIKSPSNSQVLIKYLEQRAEDFQKKIDTKTYRPSDASIQDFRILLRQERWEYTRQVSNDKQAQKRIKEIYKAMDARLEQEAERKHTKYSLSIRELIKLQQNTQGIGKHNEILASNTKGATRAFYASKDTLVDRLNLAYHAMQIKARYKYDVPLLIMSEEKTPYHYSQALIKADLQEAYDLLKDGKFPYDKTLYKVYELDAEGKIALDSKGKNIVKKNKRGHDVKEPKNLSYQKELLLKLFQLGIPALSHIEQLRHGKMGTADEAIDSIIEQMDLVGGLKRETQLMNEIFAKDDLISKEKFFLRCASLGHQSLIEKILSRDDFKLTERLLNKAIQFADKNQHAVLSDALINIPYKVEKQAIIGMLCSLEKSITLSGNLFKFYENRIEELYEVRRRYNVLNKKFDISDLDKRMQQKIAAIYLNASSRNERNEKNLPAFIKLLDENPRYLEQYICILAANETVKLDQLIEAHERHGVDYVIKAMSKIATDGWEAAKDYLILVEINALDKAEDYLNTSGVMSTALMDTLREECMDYIHQIRIQAFGKTDSQTHDYCDTMTQIINNSEGNYVALNYNLQKLKEIHKAVYSLEMMAVKAQVERFEHDAQSFFGIGNQAKANRIINAVNNVPLKDRLSIFSNEENFACNEVRKALASHRISFSNPVKQDKVDSDNAATSFKEVQKKINHAFKEKFHANIYEQKNDFVDIYSNSPKVDF